MSVIHRRAVYAHRRHNRLHLPRPEDILPVVRHWQSLNLNFDAIYTGFLGSFEQLDIIMEVFAALKTPDNLILVDPVMADNGKLYSVFPPDFPKGMKKLCAVADIIVPNMTEAALLVGDAYREGPYDKAYIEDLFAKLADIGPQRIVLTGVYFDEAELGAAVYDRARSAYLMSRKIPGFITERATVWQRCSRALWKG